MHANELKRFQKLLSDVLAFYRQDVSDFALSVWWQSCSGFEFEQVSKALTAHAMDPDRGQFAPKPADLVRTLRGTVADRSLVAWGKLLSAMQHVGAYRSVCFDDPAIHAAVVDMGGWQQVCRSEVDDLPFVQKRFCESHRTYSQRKDMPYTPFLVGVSDDSNRNTGHPVEPPVLIGDPEAAKNVMRLGTSGPKTAITFQRAGAIEQLETMRNITSRN